MAKIPMVIPSKERKLRSLFVTNARMAKRKLSLTRVRNNITLRNTNWSTNIRMKGNTIRKFVRLALVIQISTLVKIRTLVAGKIILLFFRMQTDTRTIQADKLFPYASE